MPRLYFIRHAKSEANEQGILASRLDYPLSRRGFLQASEIAEVFCNSFSIDRIIVSPLKRARQTSAFFEKRTGIQGEVRAELTEQHLGKYSGMSYSDIKLEKDYEHDRAARWDWVPEGGGESYAMLVQRINPLLKELSKINDNSHILLVTHAVTLRLIRAILEATLPEYPLSIPRNAEIWEVNFTKLGKHHDILIQLLVSDSETSSRI